MPIDFIKTAEELPSTTARTNNFDFNLFYSKLILQEDTPSHVSFLTDWLRGIKFKLHWNEVNKTMDLCNSHYKEECELCKQCDKKAKKGERLPFPSELRCMFVYCYDKIGVKKESSNGTIYEEDPICIAEIRKGTGGINFETLLDANGEHSDFMDPYSYYDVKKINGNDEYVLVPERLNNNFLMVEENGDSKIWQLRKSKVGEKVSYLEPKHLSHSKARQNLGKEANLKVPKEVRDYFSKKSAKDLLPFMLVNYGNINWSLLGLEPPKEGDKFSLVSKTKVDAGKDL